MPLYYRYDDLADRFQKVRDWAKGPFPDLNRCAVCMSYTLQVGPAHWSRDVALGDLPDAKKKIAAANPTAPARDLTPNAADDIMVRASQLLPRVQDRFGPADVQGKSSVVWPRVEGRRGVLYLEDCYATAGDKQRAEQVGVFMRGNGIGNPFMIAGAVAYAAEVFATGDHWDLFDGALMVSEQHPIRNNTHSGELYFWQAAE